MTDASDSDIVRDAEPASPAIAPAALERQPMPKEVAEAIVMVMSELKKLEYTQTNTYSNYRYAGVDDFYEAVRPLMAQAGLVIVPEEISTSSREACRPSRAHWTMSGEPSMNSSPFSTRLSV